MKYIFKFQHTISQKVLLRIIYLLSVFTILLVALFLRAEHQKELENIALDEYNFEQLEEVKSILSEIPREEYRFTRLSEFNKNHNQDIQPKRDCYYIKSTHYFEDENYSGGQLGYIFGFKIYSKKYLKEYPKGYLDYPKYDLPEREVCVGDIFGDSGEYTCYDKRFSLFKARIDGRCIN